jgi:hypothetical protein
MKNICRRVCDIWDETRTHELPNNTNVVFGEKMNDKLRKLWTEMVMAYFKIPSKHFLDWLRKPI